MNGDRWQRVREIFQTALEHDAMEWPAVVAEACGGDADLRVEVESLLAAHRAAEDFLAGPQGDDLEIRSLVGQRIGPYQVAQRLGSGGMGVVYLAFRADREYRRRVALKVLKPGLDSEEVIRRFRAERQILAALDHPNIARLLDGGTTEQGLPYFAMEYVEGQPIDVYCAERHLSVDERLELLRTVCAAVEHAHRNLVVHRDLKPSNILVSADGTPKLLDFGIAKLVNPEISSATLAITALGLQPMTPDYASPEQVQGEHVTTASDVYSLGVLLYELLTGRHPYRSRASSLAEMRRLISEEEPERPSLAVMRRDEDAGEASGAAAARGPAPAGDRGRLRRQLAGDLDNIVLKALQKDPRRRYGSVEQLSEDLRRHRERLPVTARRSTLAYRAGRFIHRHRVGVAAAAGLLVAILGFGIAMGALAVQLSRERDRAEQVTSFLTSIFEVSDPWRSNGETISAREILDAGAARLRTELANEPLVRSSLMETIGTIYQRLGLLDRAQPLLEATLATRRQLLGEEAPEVADALSALATVRDEKGETQAAIDLVSKALAIRRRVYGPRHQTVASSLHELGLLLRRQGDLAAAEGKLREALTLRRALSPPARRDVADSLNGLGIVLWERGRYQEAELATREALAIRREVLGRNRVEVAGTLNLLAVIAVAKGDLDQAESLLREALALRRRIFGSEHPRTAESLNNLGALLKDRGKLDEAEGFLREALTMRRKLLGEQHLSVATTLENLGWLALERQDYSTAARLQQQSLAIRTRMLGRNHGLVADSLVALAIVLERQESFDEAEEALRESLRIRREALGDQHVLVAVSLQSLASLLARRGRSAEAERLAVEAVNLVRRMQPVIPARLAEAERVLANCLAAQRRYAAAEPLLLKSLETLRSELGEAAPTSREALADLVALYESWGKPKQAAEWRRKLVR
ncbi:MAG TPA: serine/threonine-protein kinase [Thermoanaerobaculia bacterium]|jgi:serine/threonine-protein kinase